MLSALTSRESRGHPKSLGNTPLLKNPLTGVIQQLLAIPPESSCYLKNVCGCIQDSISRAGMGGNDWYSRVQSFLPENTFHCLLQARCSFLEILLPTHTFVNAPGWWGGTVGPKLLQTVGAAQYILGVSQRKIFLLKSFVIETRENYKSMLDCYRYRGKR